MLMLVLQINRVTIAIFFFMINSIKNFNASFLINLLYLLVAIYPVIIAHVVLQP